MHDCLKATNVIISKHCFYKLYRFLLLHDIVMHVIHKIQPKIRYIYQLKSVINTLKEKCFLILESINPNASVVILTGIKMRRHWKFKSRQREWITVVRRSTEWNASWYTCRHCRLW